MDLVNFLYTLAAYDCGAYGAGNYNQGACEGTATGGSLAYTGEPLLLFLGLAVVIIAVSAFLYFKKGSRKK